MTSRPPSEPPVLVGFRPIELIGTGGYADVFLYEQLMPNRKVAVKVLVSDVLTGDAQRRQFAAEANLMAKVSTHPYIVTIFQADVASDGRPYLVMEYYPGDNYLQRARREQFGVAEVLRVGVQVGSAVHTAHLADILHRDIKPANILTSEFRRPGLTDFGIASAQGPEVDESGGVSIPWSPPEALGSGDLGVAADVYSLAATLFHLLRGHSPFEIAGGDNSALALMARIERGQLPRIGRPEVPASLERVLGQAMAKNPNSRPATVVDFLLQLQGVEAELKLAVTPLELADFGSSARVRSMPDDDDATRVKGVTEIPAQGSGGVAISSIPSNPIGVGPVADRPREGLLAEPAVPDTVPRLPIAVHGETAAVESSRSRRWGLVGAAALGVLALGAVASTQLGDDTAGSPTTTTLAFGDASGQQVITPIAAVADIAGEVQADGSISFTWDAPGHEAGDTYQLLQHSASTQLDLGTTSELGVVVAHPTPGEEVCLDVTALRQFSSPSAVVTKCVTP